jgi:L-asparaginase
MSKKRIYVAYTGGTIGMKASEQGFVPEQGYLKKELLKLSELNAPEMPEIEVNEYDRLIDSANISPRDWHQITQDIESHYHEFDGFVVLHGTDTMAYTASALSFMLEDLSKPVIVTGSQIPWSQLRTDAKDNLLTSLILAGFDNLPEVGIYFHNRLYRGNRCRKIDASGFHAFDSPNFPPLAEVGTDIKMRKELLLQNPAKPLKVRRIEPPKVAIVTLFPGFSAEILARFIDSGVEGLVLMSYGMGNVPSDNKALLNTLRQASDDGVIIVNCSQCYRGRVNMSGYETGQALADCGAISGADMTPEATLTKLSYLLSTDLEKLEIKRQMQRNLRGELSDQ